MAALSLFDHLQLRYLVPHNPFFKLLQRGSRTARAGSEEPAGGAGAATPPAARRAGGLAVHWRSLTRRPAHWRVPPWSGEHGAARASSRSDYASGESDVPRRPSPTTSHLAMLPGYATSRHREDSVPGRPPVAATDAMSCRGSLMAADGRREFVPRAGRATRLS
jgi:hypothetical protein